MRRPELNPALDASPRPDHAAPAHPRLIGGSRLRDSREAGISPLSIAAGIATTAIRRGLSARLKTITALTGTAVVFVGCVVAFTAGGIDDSGSATFPRTVSGDSYGAIIRAQSPEGEPDLISAVATNGVSGYVRKSDLMEADGQNAVSDFKSPDDAIAWQASHGAESRSINVYMIDGETVVGTMVIGGQ